MSGNLSVDTSGLNWSKIKFNDSQIEHALDIGARVVLARSDQIVPKRSHDLENSGSVKVDRGGAKTVGIVYDSVYARWVHEHLWFKHPFGGSAKFLETAMHEKGKDAMRLAALELLK